MRLYSMSVQEPTIISTHTLYLWTFFILPVSFSNASLVGLFLNCISLSHPLIWDLISLHV